MQTPGGVSGVLADEDDFATYVKDSVTKSQADDDAFSGYGAAHSQISGMPGRRDRPYTSGAGGGEE
jgi:hypothetical protein